MSAEARREMERTKEPQHVLADIAEIESHFGAQCSSADIVKTEDHDKQGVDYVVTLRGGYLIPGKGPGTYTSHLYVDSKFRWGDREFFSTFWKQPTRIVTPESYSGEPQLTLPYDADAWVLRPRKLTHWYMFRFPEIPDMRATWVPATLLQKTLGAYYDEWITKGGCPYDVRTHCVFVKLSVLRQALATMSGLYER